MSGRKKTEKFFRDYLTTMGIDCSTWQSVVRVLDKTPHYTYYNVKFYWANGYCEIRDVRSVNGQIKDFYAPELHKVGE